MRNVIARMMPGIEAINLRFVHEAHPHVGEETDDAHFARVERGADGAEARLGVDRPEGFRLPAEARDDRVSIRDQSDQMIQQRTHDEGHIARDTQRMRLRGRMEGGVDSAERAFVGEHVSEERNAEIKVVIRAVGNDDRFRADPGDLREEVLNDRAAEHPHEGFVRAHAGAFASGEDGDGERVGHGLDYTPVL